MLIEHITMSGESVTTRHEIQPDSPVVRLSPRERRKLDRAYRIAAKRRDKRSLK